MHLHTLMCVHTHTHAHTYMYSHTHTCTQRHVYTHKHTYKYMHKHTHKHRHAWTHTQTHTHMHRCAHMHTHVLWGAAANWPHSLLRCAQIQGAGERALAFLVVFLCISGSWKIHFAWVDELSRTFLNGVCFLPFWEAMGHDSVWNSGSTSMAQL